MYSIVWKLYFNEVIWKEKKKTQQLDDVSYLT